MTVRLLAVGMAAVWLCGVMPGWAAADGAGPARLLSGRALEEEARGAHAEALADLTSAIAMQALPGAEQARLLFERGLILDQAGRFEAAAADYTAVIRLTPGYAPALNNRANIYRRQERLDEAKRDYRASLAAGNGQPEYSWYGLGEIAEAEGDRALALEDYGRAVAANPAFGLAADRLTALGGSMPASEPPIHLRPPPAVGKAEGAPIVLRPPSSALRARPVRPIAPPPAIALAGQGPLLRPALDSAGARHPEVQLGAWRTQEEARDGWKKKLAQAGDLLAGLSPSVVAADLPGRGRFFRLRAGPVKGPAAALCAALSARDISCIPVRD